MSFSPVTAAIAAHRRREAVGLYSVCSSHPLVLKAAIQVAKASGGPLLVEATSNQVDQFGGYTGMTPAAFRDFVRGLADSAGLPRERLVLGGDHLGPNAWQHLDAATAMQHARTLIATYVQAGFHKIHLDCSMRCADDPEILSDAVMAARAADLAQVAEHAAKDAGLEAPVYVIGTEVPIPGGEANLAQAGAVTRAEAAARTLNLHREAFLGAGLRAAWQRVLALVVQPGVDFDHSAVQHYAPGAAADLSDWVAGQPGLVYEAHSTDYQHEGGLHALVRDHFAILKVGPALSFAMREALLALDRIEAELVAPEQRASLMATLDQAMLANPRHWQKHYPGDSATQQRLRRFGLSDRCRYYWGEPEVAAAMARLFANLDAQPMPLALLSQYMPRQYEAVCEGSLAARAEDLVIHHIALMLAPYARACQANGKLPLARAIC